MTLRRTSLTPHAGSMGDPDPVQSHQACRRAFHDAGVLCVRLDEATERKLGWERVQMLKLVGIALYGAR